MKTILAIFILIFKAPLLGLMYLFKHRILLILLVILIGGAIAWRSYHQSSSNKQVAGEMPALPSYQQIAPDKKTAPYILATSSRVYYIEKCLEDKNTVTLQKYYIYNKKKWTMRDKMLVLDKAVMGKIEVKKR